MLQAVLILKNYDYGGEAERVIDGYDELDMMVIAWLLPRFTMPSTE